MTSIRKSIVSGTAWMLIGYASRLGIQLTSFILLARTLGPDGFGAFAGTLAIVTLVAPFVEMGGYSLVVRDIAAGVPSNKTFGGSLRVLFSLAPIGFLVISLIKILLLGVVPWSLVLSVGIAHFFGERVILLVLGANTGKGLLWRNAVLEVLGGLIRLMSVLLLMYFGGGLRLWAALYLVQYMVTAVVAVAWFAYTWGFPSLSFGKIGARIQSGLHFAIGALAQAAFSDIDKAMLVRLSSVEASGVYAAAYRLVVVALLPMSALFSSLYPHVFKEGEKGPLVLLSFMLRIVPLTVFYAVLAIGALWEFGPFFLRLLGGGYDASVNVLRLLSLGLLVQAIYYPFADVLTGSGYQHIRTKGQLAALAVSVIGNLLLIPAYSWMGAAWTLLLSYLVLTVHAAYAAFRLSFVDAGGEEK